MTISCLRGKHLEHQPRKGKVHVFYSLASGQQTDGHRPPADTTTQGRRELADIRKASIESSPTYLVRNCKTMTQPMVRKKTDLSESTKNSISCTKEHLRPPMLRAIQHSLQLNLSKRDIFKRDVGLSGTFVLAF
jgi:hypothetical protein